MKAWLQSRRGKVLIVTLLLLLLIDAARSVYARFGYQTPTDRWAESGKEFTDLMWPPGSNLPTGTPVGQRVYIERCAVCHGVGGEGNGPASAAMQIKPRNFTAGQFKYKSTPAGQPPTDDDLIAVVRDGLQASAMPYWSDVLSVAEIRAVVDYVKTFSTVFAGEPPQPLTIPPRVKADAASIERGRQLYFDKSGPGGGCVECHGVDGRGLEPMQELIAPRFEVLSRDLTAPWEFRGGAAPEQLWLRLSNGLAPSPMPAFAATLTPAQRWDVVNYVLSLARTPPWQQGGALDGPGHSKDLLKRGHYLAKTEMCGLCHTPTNTTGIYRGNDRWLSGGMWTAAYPYGILMTRNLTADQETGLGRWSEAQIATALRTGRTPDRILNPFAMPWPLFHNLQEEDALALAKYLKTLPPVRNFVPPPLRYGFVETVVAKTSMLPVVRPEVLTYEVYAFGDERPAIPRHIPQQVMIYAQFAVLAIGLVLYVVLSPAGRRAPRSLRGWLGLLGFVLLAVAATLIYHYPTLPFVPADKISRAVTGGFHQPDYAAIAQPEQAALVRRGQYLYKTIACGNCHGPDGAGGGKISWGGTRNVDGTWNGSGTYWTQNLTPDPATGIGAWNDRQIARAIRSGMTAAGRPIHWQGMIWDHTGNLAEEDVRAVIAYLKTMPPVVKEIPEPLPPGADACGPATVWLPKTNFQTGCR